MKKWKRATDSNASILFILCAICVKQFSMKHEVFYNLLSQHLHKFWARFWTRPISISVFKLKRKQVERAQIIFKLQDTQVCIVIVCYYFDVIWVNALRVFTFHQTNTGSVSIFFVFWFSKFFRIPFESLISNFSIWNSMFTIH